MSHPLALIGFLISESRGKEPLRQQLLHYHVRMSNIILKLADEVKKSQIIII